VLHVCGELSYSFAFELLPCEPLPGNRAAEQRPSFRQAAENAHELKKADRVYVEGTLKLDAWRGKGSRTSRFDVVIDAAARHFFRALGRARSWQRDAGFTRTGPLKMRSESTFKN
jgi:Single-strand binding protein family